MVSIKRETSLSIIIPTLNEAKRLPLLLSDINLCPYSLEILIVDAGSVDLTLQIAELYGVKILKVNEANRGMQMRLGASNSNGDWMLFIHADSRLDPNWFRKIKEIINKKTSKNIGWFFDLKINSERIDLKFLEFLVFLRSKFLQRPYGDQGLLINESFYSNCEGFKEIHIMEDLDLVIRISKKGRLKRIALPIKTDSKKWEKNGILSQAIKNAKLRKRWEDGVDTKSLLEDYYAN